jgi:hypothetical protein
MLNEILFVITIFLTRVVLPVSITFILGAMLERKLNRAPRGA